MTESLQRIEPELLSRQQLRAPQTANTINKQAAPGETTGSQWFPRFVDNLHDNWMIWLGGACVTLAGVFLVRYSVEQGLLGPLARILMALLFGVAFHVLAEWLRRRSGAPHGALAALAGAGSITLYAGLFAALRLYQLIQPGSAFMLMAGVAVATMTMARVHGPVLAAFGILGAYLVPILVSDGSGDILIALIYAVVVSASALLLMRYVYRRWLWWGFAAGALGWWLITLSSSGADGYRTLYLTAIAYLMSAIPDFDWPLGRRTTATDDNAILWPPHRIANTHLRDRALLLLGMVGATAVNILVNPVVHAPWLVGLPFFVLSVLLARRDEALSWLPWFVLVCGLAAWMFALIDFSAVTPALALIPAAERQIFLSFLFVQALLAAGFSLFTIAGAQRPAFWASLAALAPVLSLAVAYLLAARPEASSQWALVTLIAALAYLALAASVSRRATQASLVVWLFVAGHFALALAAAMAFKSASLTLALAAQFVSLAWVIQHFRLPELGWLIKLLGAIVIARLTLNPWLPAYPSDVHWSLWTYGGATIFAGIGAYILRGSPRLSAWLEAAALHLLVLTAWAELRYQMYDGFVFARQYNFSEAVVSMLLFASLALVYHRRASLSRILGRFMRIYSYALLALAVCIYGGVLVRTLSSEAWVYLSVGRTPILNILLAGFGMPVVLGVLYALFFRAVSPRLPMMFSAAAAFVFVSLEIRHLWTGTVRLNFPAVSDPELYTYSVVWLLIAIVALLLGSWKLGKDCYRGGMLLLALVIAKLFLLDLSDLEGLLRVASFMGLGLSLLAVSFLHQRLSAGAQERPEIPGPGA
ncbi:MAG: DUF2339 domain-containing protein [Congregibacter sp.]